MEKKNNEKQGPLHVRGPKMALQGPGLPILGLHVTRLWKNIYLSPKVLAFSEVLKVLGEVFI